MSVESIFEAMPVSETTQAPSEAKEQSTKEMGDRVRKGDVNSRIEAFGEMLGDDDYGGGKPKEHEPVKVEKEKTAIAKPEDKKDDKEPEEKEEVLEEKPKEIPQKQPEVSKDTKIKVKVDGQDVEVPLQELMNDYAGKQAISKRFTELDKEKKNFQKEKNQVLADGEAMRREIADLRSGFESSIAEFKKNGFTAKNPLALVDQLLDRLGIDSHYYNRAVFEHNLPEYAQFFEMDDVQRDAYFAKKENEFLRKKDQTFAERTRQAQELQQRQAQEFNLIKKSGLSVDDFNQHFDELRELGSDDLSVENVLEFARIKPIFDKAGAIVSKTPKAGDVDLIQNVSRLLMEFPNTTEEEIIEHITGKKAAKDASKRASGKENYSVDTRGISRKSQSDDMSDEDMEMFKAIRRR